MVGGCCLCEQVRQEMLPYYKHNTLTYLDGKDKKVDSHSFTEVGR